MLGWLGPPGVPLPSAGIKCLFAAPAPLGPTVVIRRRINFTLGPRSGPRAARRAWQSSSSSLSLTSEVRDTSSAKPKYYSVMTTGRPGLEHGQRRCIRRGRRSAAYRIAGRTEQPGRLRRASGTSEPSRDYGPIGSSGRHRHHSRALS
jgi:hypothetical protein